jgi:hypothetical protein
MKLSTDELSEVALALPLSNLSKSLSDEALLAFFSVEGAPVEPVEAEFKFLIIFFSDGILQTYAGELKPVVELLELFAANVCEYEFKPVEYFFDFHDGLIALLNLSIHEL